jgi:hypothetical protein
MMLLAVMLGLDPGIHVESSQIEDLRKALLAARHRGLPGQARQ